MAFELVGFFTAALATMIGLWIQKGGKKFTQEEFFLDLVLSAGASLIATAMAGVLLGAGVDVSSPAVGGVVLVFAYWFLNGRRMRRIARSLQ